ncbi:MAG TPA: hypothetical protein VIN10_04055 [Bacteroidales bacterium]
MKRILTVLLIAFLFLGAFSIQSCNKCATCQYTYENLAGEQVTFTYAEVCGNNSDVNNYKDTCEAAAEAYTDGNCTCVDN